MSKRILSIFLFLLFYLIINPPVFGQSQNSCVDCHGKEEVISSLPEEWQEYFKDWSNSIHGQSGIGCERCHGGDSNKDTKELSHKDMKKSSDPESPTYYKNNPEMCSLCHREVYDEFKTSLMYHNLEVDELSPTCATCMGSHSVSVVDALKISEKCEFCHNDQLGIKPDVPKKAKRILQLQEQVKIEIQRAQGIIKTGKEMGQDVSEAEVALQEAVSRMDNTESKWHRFRLDELEGEMLDSLYYTFKANNLIYGSQPSKKEKSEFRKETKKGICGPIALMLLAMLPPAIQCLRKRK